MRIGLARSKLRAEARIDIRRMRGDWRGRGMRGLPLRVRWKVRARNLPLLPPSHEYVQSIDLAPRRLSSNHDLQHRTLASNLTAFIPESSHLRQVSLDRRAYHPHNMRYMYIRTVLWKSGGANDSQQTVQLEIEGQKGTPVHNEHSRNVNFLPSSAQHHELSARRLISFRVSPIPNFTLSSRANSSRL